MAKVKATLPVDVAAQLRLDNKTLRAVDLRVFADALSAYCEASENIRRNGTIVMHPRTGAPIENPYLKISKQAGQLLTKMRLVKADRVLALLHASILATANQATADAAKQASVPKPDRQSRDRGLHRQAAA